MFKIVMTIAVVLLAAGWIAYGIYELKMRAEEKKHPREPSERLKKTRGEVSDWAQKMAQWESPAKKRAREAQQQQDKQQEDT